MQRNFEFRISKKYDIVLCVLVLCTQMNMMFVMLLSVHPHRASCHILEYIDIEGTRLVPKYHQLEPTGPRSSVGRALD